MLFLSLSSSPPSSTLIRVMLFCSFSHCLVPLRAVLSYSHTSHTYAVMLLIIMIVAGTYAVMLLIMIVMHSYVCSYDASVIVVVIVADPVYLLCQILSLEKLKQVISKDENASRKSKTNIRSLCIYSFCLD